MAKNSGSEGIQTGTVVSVADPTYAGRIKVRIKGVNDNIEVENLPWVTFGGSAFFSGNGGGSISIPRVGANVRVKFKKDDPNSMEWYATNRIDRDLAAEIAGDDYEGSHAILYDSASDLSIMYKNSTGLQLYYKGSFIQLSPDNNITIHYGSGNTGTQIQLSDGAVDIQSSKQINITADSTIKLEAQTIQLNGTSAVQIKGSTAGEIAVNGKNLYRILLNLARLIDAKIPASSGMACDAVSGSVSTMYNEQIQYI